VNIPQTYELGIGLMIEHGLYDKGWKFDIDNAKSRVGLCSHNKQIISVSRHFLHNSDEEIKDTILHEIAHALIGAEHGHDALWRTTARRIGARPQRLAGEEVTRSKKASQHNYLIVCSGCGQEWRRLRLRKSLMRPGVKSGCCGEPLKFYKITRRNS
jgi:predicted SprT family Zn-dependent metalloprotease